MTRLADLLLGRPLPPGWMHALLFGTFALHLALVLLMLGTAILGVHAYAVRLAAPAADATWSGRVLRRFLPFEALAVVLGVGPLLLVQVGWTVPFFSASNVLAPYWVALIVLMIAAFLSLDVVEHRADGRSRWSLALALAGLVCLLSIPGVFVGVLLLAEHPEEWLPALRARDRLAGAIGWTWLARYLHVIGAAIVIAAAFHATWTAKDDAERRRGWNWVLGGVLAQIAIGIAVYALVADRAAGAILWTLAAAVAAVLVTAALAISGVQGARAARLGVPVAAAATLVLMLLVREGLQVPVFRAVNALAADGAAALRSSVAPHVAPALEAYRRRAAAPVGATGAALFDSSCAFCHGEAGDGDGAAARDLAVPPEVLQDVRIERAELERVLRDGVPGSGMARFGYYDAPRIARLVDELQARFGVLDLPAAHAGAELPDAARRSAGAVWTGTCAACHGDGGEGTPFGRTLRPAVPDLRRAGLTADGAYRVVTRGYPGTVMVSYGELEDPVRRALAARVVRFRSGAP